MKLGVPSNATATSIVMPAFFEAASVGPFVQALRSTVGWHEVLVVDDGSPDDTAVRATTADARVVRHPQHQRQQCGRQDRICGPMRTFIPLSTAAFLVGAAYALWTVSTRSHVTKSSVLLIVSSAVVFLAGLVLE